MRFPSLAQGHNSGASNEEVSLLNEFTQHFRAVQDTTQNQFFSGVKTVWIRIFHLLDWWPKQG